MSGGKFFLSEDLENILKRWLATVSVTGYHDKNYDGPGCRRKFKQ